MAKTAKTSAQDLLDMKVLALRSAANLMESLRRLVDLAIVKIKEDKP